MRNFRHRIGLNFLPFGAIKALVLLATRLSNCILGKCVVRKRRSPAGRLLLALFMSGCSVLIAQNDPGEQEARILHEEGISLLQKTPVRAFDKIQALEKFIQSQKRLLQSPGDHGDLYKRNEQQLQSLSGFFAQFQDSDSLLQLTQFYPDSLFQQNDFYSHPFKLLVRNYLDAKQSATRTEFFNIGDLSIPGRSASEISLTPVIDFRNYWPLEVIEFEEWMQGIENRLRLYPQKYRDELRYLHLQHRMDSLILQIGVSNHARSQRLLREEVTKAEEARSEIETRYRQLKIIGFGAIGILLILGFMLWGKSNQLLKRKNQLVLEEKKRSDYLLSNMLPAEMVGQLKSRGSVIARRHERVSVMFSDFKQFSQIAKTLTPEELVGELNDCFTAFDHIIEKYRLQKIKTIGDAYMCIGGLYTRGDQHIHRMVAAALEIQQFLTSRKIKSAASAYLTDARIGIHTGPVVVGVVGAKKIAFDVWGDTVNVAQQMEHHGEVGKVNISEDTFEIIKNKFQCAYRGKVMIKNQKEYDMYFVEKAIV